MKVNIEIDCSPDEARRFMGLPEVEKVNQAYVDGVMKAMQGATNIEQMEKFARNIAPMGEMGLRFFQNMMEAGGGGKTRSKSKSGSDG